MAKTEFEKAVIIKMRRLRRKKKLFEQMQEEMGDRSSKEEMAEFIKNEAAELSIKDRREINAKRKLHKRPQKGVSDNETASQAGM